jgi:hypothetical protein
MTATISLYEAIDDALEHTSNGATRAVIRYLQMYHRRVLDENSLTIEASGLGPMIRGRRKRPDPKDLFARNQNFCLDFGLPYLDLDDEISVPLDLDNVLNSECDWPSIEDATIDDLDKHLILSDAQEAAHVAKTKMLRTLRQAAAKVVLGRTDIRIGDLRAIAASTHRRQKWHAAVENEISRSGTTSVDHVAAAVMAEDSAYPAEQVHAYAQYVLGLQ